MTKTTTTDFKEATHRKAKCPMCHKMKTTLVARVTPHRMGYRPDDKGQYLKCDLVHPCSECYTKHEANSTGPKWEQYKLNGECPRHKGRQEKDCCPKAGKKKKAKKKEKPTAKVQLTSSLINKTLRNGPTEIMVGEESKVKRSAATDEQREAVTVIFFRDDGVTIGAPQQYAVDAAVLESERWIGVIQKPDREPKTFQEWMKTRPR